MANAHSMVSSVQHAGLACPRRAWRGDRRRCRMVLPVDHAPLLSLPPSNGGRKRKKEERKCDGKCDGVRSGGPQAWAR
uniref:Uncharacterized protein n=1 Tax=Oryza glumipatula TaxID=40148 RepID=A0A0D9ZV60_9ORYZ